MPLLRDDHGGLTAVEPALRVTDDPLNRAGLRCLDIGLLNNMPDAALRATESHYSGLLAAAAVDLTVRLHVFSLPEIARSEAGLAHVAGTYRDCSTLWDGRLDALIVTGAEPKASLLTEEPYWSSLARVIDWAEHRTFSTIWSCLAAHAAVLHLDGISRQRLPAKCSGLFECSKTAEAPLLAGLPEGFVMPHSRWHDLREAELEAHGYRILSRSGEAGVDAFCKPWRSLFVFFQGHPEYGIDTLYREYRRDIQRYLEGTSDRWPALPVGYFDAGTEQGFALFAERARVRRHPSTFGDFPLAWAPRQPQVDRWRQAAVMMFRNWLREVAEAKAAMG